MKNWTSKEIDKVCELVGGNPEEIIRQLQSRLEELNQKVEELEKENTSLKRGTVQHYLEALPVAWIHFPPKKAELARVDFYPQAKTKEIGSGWITVPLYKETNA